MSKRKCLRCQKEFDSAGTGNRICKKCAGMRGAHTTSVKTRQMNEFKRRVKEKIGLEDWRKPLFAIPKDKERSG